MSDFGDILDHSPDVGQGGQLSKAEYAAKKKSERDKVYELADFTTLEVSGDGGRFRQHLDVQSTFDRYSVVNAMLITAQKPNATRVGDFEYWKSKDSFVKPGQSAISILEPHEYTKEDGTPGIGYNVKKVFDVSQVDTRNIKAAPAPSYTDRQLLRALISKAPMKVLGADDLPDGLGAMTDLDGSILVQRDMEFSETFRAVAYEMVSAELATDPELSFEQEFSAYSATYMLCKKYGVDTKSFDFSAAPDVFKDMDAREVRDELSQIRDAAASIAGRMARNLDAEKSKETKVRDEAR